MVKGQLLVPPHQMPHPAETAFQLDLIDSFHEAAIITDVEGRVARSNDAAFDVFGYSPSELVGKNITTLSLPGEVIFVTSLFAKALATDVCRIELRQRSKLRKVLQVQLTVRTLRDAQKVPSGLLWLYVDITPVKLAKTQEHAQFDVLTQALPQLIWWADKHGDIINATSRTLDFFGFRSSGSREESG